MRHHRVPVVLALLAAASLTFAACGSAENPPPEATADITEMHGAFWAADPPAQTSTLPLTEMHGAFWAAAGTLTAGGVLTPEPTHESR